MKSGIFALLTFVLINTGFAKDRFLGDYQGSKYTNEFNEVYFNTVSLVKINGRYELLVSTYSQEGGVCDIGGWIEKWQGNTAIFKKHFYGNQGTDGQFVDQYCVIQAKFKSKNRVLVKGHNCNLACLGNGKIKQFQAVKI